MKQTSLTPKDFINSLPENRKEIILELDKIIAPLFESSDRYMLEGKFWGGSDQQILSYGRYSYIRSDKKEVNWFIIGLANQKDYVSLFISAVEDREYLAQKYKDKFGKVEAKTSRVKIKKLEHLDLKGTAEVIKLAKQLIG